MMRASQAVDSLYGNSRIRRRCRLLSPPPRSLRASHSQRRRRCFSAIVSLNKQGLLRHVANRRPQTLSVARESTTIIKIIARLGIERRVTRFISVDCPNDGADKRTVMPGAMRRSISCKEARRHGRSERQMAKFDFAADVADVARRSVSRINGRS